MASSRNTDQKSTAAVEASLARAIAPEDIRTGDFVTPLFMIAEVPSYFWNQNDILLPRDEPVRIRFTSSCDGAPLKVQSVCLPFVLVKTPAGDRGTLDVRKCQLACLDESHGRRAWKAYKKAISRRKAGASGSSS